MKKAVKTLAVASLAALATISLIGCDKNTEPTKQNTINIEQDAKGNNGDIIKDKDLTTGSSQIQNTGDVIKDEASWPIGKFGYHEPPEELRKDAINPVTKKPYKDFYSIHLHSDKYGNLTLNYSNNGQRTLFEGNDGTDPTKQLIIIGKDNPISIEQALEDLRIGDSIADNFGK